MKLFNKPSFCYQPINMETLNKFYFKLASIEDAKHITINGRMAQDTHILSPLTRAYLEEDARLMEDVAKEVFDASDMNYINFYVPTYVRNDERSVKFGIRLDNNASGLVFKDTLEDIEAIMISKNVAYIETERPLDIIMDNSYFDNIEQYLFQAGGIARNLAENGSIDKIVGSIKTKIGFEKYQMEDGRFCVMQFHIARDKDPNNRFDMTGLDGTHQLLPILMLYDERRKTYSLEVAEEELSYLGQKSEFAHDLHKTDMICHAFPRVYETYLKQETKLKAMKSNSEQQ